MTHDLTFDAVSESRPGPKWRARWTRSWPAYRAWFTARDGAGAPDREAAEDALRRHMPEIAPIHADLTRIAGGGDQAARFLAAWCPPSYLGGCSLAALHRDGETRLIRNYDLAPDLNEGLLMRTRWRKPVMGMMEFLWGLSDGINGDGLSVALAHGGTVRTGPGFGICAILRYVLEVCSDLPEALEALACLPSHMDYNLALADAAGRTASVEMHAGGGMTRRSLPIATNHQIDAPLPDRAAFTRTVERRAELARLVGTAGSADGAVQRFLAPPLYRRDYANGFGTLFTAVYDPAARSMRLLWPGAEMAQSLARFREERRTITYDPAEPRDAPALADIVAGVPECNRQAAERWLADAEAGRPDWVALGQLFAEGTSRVA